MKLIRWIWGRFAIFTKSNNMSDQKQIEWVSMRISVTRDMYDDLKYIKGRCGTSMSDFARPKILLGIEELSKAGLHVGENRHKRTKEF